jgi:hypothetical protein
MIAKHRLRILERERGAEGHIWAERCEIEGGWRKLHNEELHILYSSPIIIIMLKGE